MHRYMGRGILTQRRKDSQRLAEGSFSLRLSAFLGVSALRLIADLVAFFLICAFALRSKVCVYSIEIHRC